MARASTAAAEPDDGPPLRTVEPFEAVFVRGQFNKSAGNKARLQPGLFLEAPVERLRVLADIQKCLGA